MQRSRQTGRRPRRGNVLTIVVALLIVAAVIAGVVVMLGRGSAAQAAAERERDIFVVSRGAFSVTIPASGELTALNQAEIRNPLDVRAVVTEIVPEGVMVKAGDVLLRLADDELRTRIQEAQLDLLSAENNVKAAEKELEILRSQHESEMSNARLRVELAELALEEWREGSVKARRQELELSIEVANKDLERLRIKYDEAKNLAVQGFISQEELRNDEISFMRAQSSVRRAELDEWVYDNYQHKREEKQKLSDVDQTTEELKRVRARHEAEIARKLDDLASRRGQYDIRAVRTADFERQLGQTVVRAPRAGLVVYASSIQSNNRGNDQQTLQIGSELRKNQEILYLPDMSQLVAAVQVHESLAGRIKPGQRVTVVSDSLPNTVLNGSVLNVSVLAVSAGWRDPNRRDYTVRILLEGGEQYGLKPSMRCKAEIHLDQVDDAIHVPVQAIFRRGALAYVYVQRGSGFAQQEVRVGRTSELYAELRDGLEVGARVLLREPSQEEIVATIPVPDRAMAAAGQGGESSMTPPGTMPNQPAMPATPGMGGGGSGDQSNPEAGTDGQRPQRPAGAGTGDRPRPQRPVNTGTPGTPGSPGAGGNSTTPTTIADDA